MCGIGGIFNYRGSEPVLQEDLHAVTRSLRHRGPDDHGHYWNNKIGLGHCRLSVIDLATGRQPIFNEDRSIAAVFNGEIYNYLSLRQSLMQKGHRFYTRSDTEVIVHLYEEHGESFVERLQGMFAIALWDERSEKLLLVRDRLGIKPLFYFLDGQKLVFGSEIKAVLQYPGFERRMDLEALHDYLSFMTTRGRKTIFGDIQRLLPGEMLVCSPAGGRKWLYWDLSPDVLGATPSMTASDFRDLLEETIRSHLVSDVPIGAFVSGGIDSSYIVGVLSRLIGRSLKTFSIGFSGGGYYDESPYARRVAEHFGADHHEFVVTPALVDLVPRMLDCLDEPFAVSSALPLYLLSKLAREHVKVVLTGDGADELLGGYPHRYLAIKHGALLDRIPFLKTTAGYFLHKNGCGTTGKLRKIAAGLHRPAQAKYLSYVGQFQEDEKRSLYTPEIAEVLWESDSSREFLRYLGRYRGDDYLNRWLYVDVKTSLPDEMLTKVDRMTMAFGLEARVPFLDHLLVERVFALPSKLKLNGLASKYLLRRAAADLLPREVLNRRKHGFEVPVDEWIRGDLKEYTKEYLNETRIKRQGIFRWDRVSALLNLHWESKVDLGHRIWTLLMFEVWHEKYLA